MIYVRLALKGADDNHRSNFPIAQYLRFSPKEDSKDLFIVAEIVTFFRDGNCEHSKSWNGNSLTSSLFEPDEISEDDTSNHKYLCSESEFKTFKCLALNFCKTNESFLLPEAQLVSSWDEQA